MRCGFYSGIACDERICPKVNTDRCKKYGMPLVKTCEECYFFLGVEDCILFDTCYCDKNCVKI